MKTILGLMLVQLMSFNVFAVEVCKLSPPSYENSKLAEDAGSGLFKAKDGYLKSNNGSSENYPTFNIVPLDSNLKNTIKELEIKNSMIYHGNNKVCLEGSYLESTGAFLVREITRTKSN